MNGKSLSVILKRLTTIPTITERTGETCKDAKNKKRKNNKKNQVTGVCLTYLYKNIALPVWTKKSECYKVFFAIAEVKQSKLE